jgi:hypothetical protein
MVASAIYNPNNFENGFRLIDGTKLNDRIGNPLLSAQYGIIATAGGGQANAYPLNATFSKVATVITTGDSVILPKANIGDYGSIANAGANAFQLFGQTGDFINSTAGATGISVASGKNLFYFCAQTGYWSIVLSA